MVRPSNEEYLDKSFNFRTTRAQFDKVRLLAQQLDLDIAAVVRMLLDQALATYPEPKGTKDQNEKSRKR